MTSQEIVYVLTLNGTVLGVYRRHEDAESDRIFQIHESKQKDARVWQCVVKNDKGRGF
jgi:hypothetical protein